jgi:hypothetical protein
MGSDPRELNQKEIAAKKIQNTCSRALGNQH